MNASHNTYDIKLSDSTLDSADLHFRHSTPAVITLAQRAIGKKCRHQMVAALAGIAVVMATAGCGSEQPATAPPYTAAPGGPAPAIGMAAKLKLDEADPCKLINDGEVTGFAGGQGRLIPSREAVGGQACRMTNFPDKPVSTPGNTYLVQLLDNPGKLARDDGAVAPTEGLPTKQGTPSNFTADNTCVAVVDLTPQSTPARYLWVQYSNVARDNPTMNHQMACDRASTAAAATIKSLNHTSG